MQPPRRPPQHLLRRLPRAGVTFRATVLASVLALTSTAVGHAAPPGGALTGSIPASGSGTTGATPADTHVVTLLTGDTVTVYAPTGGMSSYTVQPAARPGRSLVSFRGTTVAGDLHVVPSDAEPYLASGAVDPQLFDVSELVREGVADGTSALPLIVTYRHAPGPAAITSTTDSLPASDRTRTLPAVHGAAIRVDRSAAGKFWDGIDQDGPAVRAGRLDFGHGISRVWLDRKVSAVLDQSVPQIGAPTAWHAGIDGTGVKVAVLDSGIDATHPDFAGRIGAVANFSTSPTAADRFGHGTHVASIVAGSGAASNGRFRGVAPGATLLIGKVLDDKGVGDASSTIAGMQWAAEHGAKVINLSLSSDSPSDGTDPLSLAVDEVSRTFGVLVVASAGNGTLLHTVNAPAAADQALAVGAVDKADRLASFSSRGPGLTSGSVKPEITAPGVSIVAARAAGTNLGPIVDTNYTRLSGTSMAAPHVAGAAALMAEQNPTWTGQELRGALVSTAKDGGFRWYEQGAGRVDVTRAFTQRVYGSRAIDFGSFAFPQSGTATRPASFSNDTDTAVTLHLALDVRDFAGAPAPDGAVRLGADTVTVPAHGRASVDLVVDPTVGPDSVYGGVLTASTSDGSVRLRTPLSWRKAPESQAVTVKVLNSHGQPVPFSLVEIVRVDFPQPNDPFVDPLINLPISDGIGQITLPRGTYSLHTLVDDLDLHTRRETLVAMPEVTIPGQVTGPPPGNLHLLLDASTGVPVRPKTPEPTEDAGIWLGLSRTSPAGQVVIQQDISLLLRNVDVYMTPTRPVQVGKFAEYDRWTLEPPLLTARAKVQSPATPTPTPTATPTTKPTPTPTTKPTPTPTATPTPSETATPGAETTARTTPGRAAEPAATTTGRISIVLHPRYDPALAAPKLAGRRTLPVVFAGPGRPEDFAGVDVTGRLALVSMPAPADTEQGLFDARTAAAAITANAGRAGAAGVLIYLDSPGALALPMPASDPILELALPQQEGDSLRAALADGPVTVSLRGRLGPKRVYQLRYDHLGGITSSYHNVVDPSTLAVVHSRYHSDRPGLVDREAWHSHSAAFPGSAVSTRTFWVPTAVTELVAEPTTPGFFWERWVFQAAGPAAGSNTFLEERTVYPPGRPARAESWFGSPIHTGMPESPTGDAIFCSMCRNVDWLVPPQYEVDADAEHNFFLFNSGAGATMRLFEGDTEIPVNTGLGYPAFLLPPDPGVFRLDLHTVQRATDVRTLASTVDTSWTFHSQRPTAGQMPAQFVCRVSRTEPCAFQPMIQLRYQLGLDLRNRAPAGTPFLFEIHAGPHSGTPGAAPVSTLSVSTSTDGNKTWRPALTLALGGGDFAVLVVNPPLAQTDGHVSLRVRASDTAGNSVVQTVTHAYALSGGGSGGSSRSDDR